MLNTDIKLKFVGFENDLTQVYQIESIDNMPILQAIMNKSYCLFLKDNNIVASFIRDKNSSNIKQQISDNLHNYFNENVFHNEQQQQIFLTCPHCENEFELEL